MMSSGSFWDQSWWVGATRVTLTVEYTCAVNPRTKLLSSTTFSLSSSANTFAGCSVRASKYRSVHGMRLLSSPVAMILWTLVLERYPSIMQLVLSKDSPEGSLEFTRIKLQSLWFIASHNDREYQKWGVSDPGYSKRSQIRMHSPTTLSQLYLNHPIAAFITNHRGKRRRSRHRRRHDRCSNRPNTHFGLRTHQSSRRVSRTWCSGLTRTLRRANTGDTGTC